MEQQLHRFCGSAFWDEYQTWNTTNPDFSPCFHQTVLVWIPCAFLWVLTPLEIIYLVKQKFQNIPWSPLIFFKLILTTGLIIVSLLQLLHKVNSNHTFLADYWAASIKLITYVLSAGLVIAAKKQGLNSSGILFLFWLLSSVCGAITYRSYFIGSLAEDPGHDYFIYVTSMIAFPLIVAQLIAAFFSDTIIRSHTHKRECPYKKASFPSVAIFAWFDSLVWNGFRKELKEDDLWALDDEFRSSYVYRECEEYCQKTREKTPLSKKQAKFLRILWELNKFEFFMAFILKIFADVISFANPLILKFLIDFISNPSEQNWKGYLFTFTMLVAAIATSMANHNYFFRLQSIGISARAT